MAKVFVVTVGTYSDYHIVRVFSEREYADAFAKLHNELDKWGDDARVEEFRLDAEPPVAAWRVILRHWPTSETDGFGSNIENLPSVGMITENEYKVWRDGCCIGITRWYQDEASAKDAVPRLQKVAEDMWAQIQELSRMGATAEEVQRMVNGYATDAS